MTRKEVVYTHCCCLPNHYRMILMSIKIVILNLSYIHDMPLESSRRDDSNDQPPIYSAADLKSRYLNNILMAFDDYVDRCAVVVLFLCTQYRHAVDAADDVLWDSWSQWSPCSTDCGKGISTRSRECRTSASGQVVDGCVGESEEIKVCESTGCIREVTSHKECRKLQSRLYGGKRYRWEPYAHPSKPCQLACRPIGAGFFQGLDMHMPDGTTCDESTDSICLKGECRDVGCDGKVGSRAVADRCGVCAGDGTSCKQIVKTFTEKQKFGYHTLTTIPQGATAIAVSEIGASRNYIAVKATDNSFQLNTMFRLSRFGDHPGAGTLFTYNRGTGGECRDECIVADGPIDVPVDVLALVYSEDTAIKVTYNIPSYANDLTATETDELTSPDVMIQGGVIRADTDESIQVPITVRKKPIFSHDFKFERPRKQRKHRHKHKHYGSSQVDDTDKDRDKHDSFDNNVDVIGETGALSHSGTVDRYVDDYNNDEDDMDETNGNEILNNTVTETNINANKTTSIETQNATVKTGPSSSEIEPVNGNEEDEEEDEEEESNSYSDGLSADESSESVTEEDVGSPSVKQQTSTGVTTTRVRVVLPKGKGTELEGDGKDGQGSEIEDGSGDLDTVINTGTDTVTSTYVTTHGPDTDDMYRNDNRIPSLYEWIVTSYTECSQTCGKGKKTSIIECVVTDKEAIVESSFCAGQAKPEEEVIKCGYGSCPPSWKAQSWSKCSKTCDIGVQIREYACVTDDGQEVSPWECGSGTRKREEKACDAGSCTTGWYYTEWEKECPAQCGYSTIARQVTCISGTGNRLTACPEREKPVSEKSCRNDDCGGFWLTGPWSKCNSTCGTGYQTRTVTCAQKHRERVTVVSDQACQEEEQPPTYMSCDLPACAPEWYMNDWGECSVTCGSGQRSRDVRCMSTDKFPSTGCDPYSKPRDREACHQRACPIADQAPAQPVTRRPSKPKVTPANDPNCKDKFDQCSLVLQARLCAYPYYSKVCCKSCSMLGS